MLAATPLHIPIAPRLILARTLLSLLGVPNSYPNHNGKLIRVHHTITFLTLIILCNFTFNVVLKILNSFFGYLTKNFFQSQ